MPLGMEVGFVPGDIVLDGDPAPPPKKGRTAAAPLFGPCLLGPAGWINMPFVTEEGLGSGHIVLDGDSAPPKGGTAAPLFGPCLLWPNGRPSQVLLRYCCSLEVRSVRLASMFPRVA